MRDEVLATPAVETGLSRVAVIFNPTAGRLRRRRLDAALARWAEAGLTVELLETGRRGDAEDFARRLAHGERAGPDAVVAAGGDGTINEVVNGMVGGRLPLGILPLGTANVLAGEIGLGADPRAAAEAVLGNCRRTIHLGACNGRYFSMMAGVGFDAHVVAAVQPRLKRAVGKLAYVYESLALIARYQPLAYRISFDGRDFDCASAIIAKGHYYAGRYVVARAARLTSPDLHVCLFGRSGRVNALRYSSAMVLGRLDRLQDFAVHPATAITIQGPVGDPVQADGDIIARLPAVIEVGAASLEILVPSAAAASG